MSEPFIGQIMMFGGNFAPRGWALCSGQLLAIAQNTALFSLLGTTYGGNGQTTFALPDLRGRVPMHMGQGPGLTPRSLGEVGGVEQVTLLSTQLPPHTHQILAAGASPSQGMPGGAALPTSDAPFYAVATPTTALNPGSVASAGGGQPHTNIQPYVVMNFIIALQGIFPSRN